MANLKDLMGMSNDVLQELGIRSGLTFPSGMRKQDMAKQLANSAASGWMEQNQELMSESSEGYDEMPGFSGTSQMLSDAAHAAQIISNAGYANTFHNVMGAGKTADVVKVQEYLNQLGASAEDVWMHMPKYNPDHASYPAAYLGEYMRDSLIAHQDIMPKMANHYAGDILGEFNSEAGMSAQTALEGLASMYLDEGAYNSDTNYSRDLQGVTRMLNSQLGSGFTEVGFTAATGGMASYMSVLPQIGSPSIADHVKHPRQALNQAGLPMGSMGSAVGARGAYSLLASLTGRPEQRGEGSVAAYNRINDAVKGLSEVYKGGTDTGLNPYKPVLASDREAVMDSASRYNDLFDVREQYELLDNKDYNRETLGHIVNGTTDWDSRAPTNQGIDASGWVSGYRDAVDREDQILNGSRGFDMLPGNGFQAEFGAPTSGRRSRQAGPSQPEVTMEQESPIKFHDAVTQGSQEWLDLRKDYTITGSTIGSYLGNNQYVNPIKELSDKIGLTARANTTNFDMERGHRLEPVARSRVGKQYGFDIQETGAVTNSNYPDMLYSPDGLIGDDAIWEHKAPREFSDLKDQPSYNDQMQLGMLITGRSKALYTQTVGSESRSEWVNRDEDWFSNNQTKINSILGRAAAGRDFMNSEAFGNMDEKDRTNAGRAAMTGDGIWAFRTQKTGGDFYDRGKRGMSRYDSNAGTDNDQFLGNTSAREAAGSAAESNPSGNTGLANPMAMAVKDGIIAAQEENKSKGQTGSGGSQADAEFDDLGSPRGWNGQNFRNQFSDEEAGGGGGRRGGGGGGGGGGRTGADAIFGGIAGGSISSVSSGVMTAMSMTPWGRVAVGAIGAAKIGDEAAGMINDSLGAAQDAGMTNPVGYASQMQGMEMMGLSESQARNVTNTTHQAYGSLLNGDAGGAVSIITATRGLVNIGDIRSTGGDPVALASIIRERGQARGWGQARISAALNSAGLQGMARTYGRGEQQGEADAVRDRGAWTNTDDSVRSAQGLQGSRMAASPTYASQRTTFESGAGVMDEAAGVVNGVRAGLGDSSLSLIRHEESGDRDIDANGDRIVSSSGARGRYQILPSTAAKPGYGLKPSDGSIEDDARLAEQYYAKLKQVNGGDERKAMAAYTDGQGTVDNAVKNFKGDWLSHMPKQAQDRVSAFDKANQQLQQGASGFTRNGMSYGQTSAPTQINVNITAKVNNQTGSATVSTQNGETVTQQVNMSGGGTQQRR